MGKNYGVALLHQQVMDFVCDQVETFLVDHPCESKIEQLLLCALYARTLVGGSEFENIFLVDDTTEESVKSSIVARSKCPTSLVVKKQAVIPARSRRADFIVQQFEWHSKRWRKLIVECDGHEFHEKTKAQAKRDKSRDRLAVLDGYDSFRFTGSEIWLDPWGCAEEITDWAALEWP